MSNKRNRLHGVVDVQINMASENKNRSWLQNRHLTENMPQFANDNSHDINISIK